MFEARSFLREGAFALLRGVNGKNNGIQVCQDCKSGDPFEKAFYVEVENIGILEKMGIT